MTVHIVTRTPVLRLQMSADGSIKGMTERYLPPILVSRHTSLLRNCALIMSMMITVRTTMIICAAVSPYWNERMLS